MAETKKGTKVKKMAEEKAVAVAETKEVDFGDELELRINKPTEHGFVRPNFRSGYFHHFNSDYFVNCKGQVRFIASTMVKGKAKTVISSEE